jgi:hypothetical protein
VRTRAASSGPCAGPLPEVLSDLAALLSTDAAIYLCLEPRGAVLSVKSPEMVAFGENLISEWVQLTPEEKALRVIEWIGKAASYGRRPRIRWAPPGRGVSA